MRHIESNKVVEKLTGITVLTPLLVAVGLVGLYFSTIIRNPYTVLYPSVLILGSLCALFVRNNVSSTYLAWERNDAKPALIGYFSVLSLLTVWYDHVGFWRTDIIFYLSFSLYVLTGVHIITGGRAPISLLLICISGLVSRITALYASVEYVGIDIYSHATWIQSIVTDHSLIGLSSTKYFYAPMYHIQVAQGQLLFDIGTKEALTLTTMSSVVIVSALVVYAITNRLWNTQIALLASLLYTGADEAINWGIHLIPTSLGIAFFSITLLSLVRYYLHGDKRMFALFIVATASLMQTHQVSLFISAALVLGFSLAIVIYSFRLPMRITHISLFTGFAVMFDFMTTKYSGPDGSQSFFEVVLETFINSLTVSGTTTRPEVALPADPRISGGGADALANIQIAGSSMLLFFAVIGALFWLHSRDENRSILVGLLLSVGVTTLLVFTLGFPIVGMRNLLPGRWWAFSYVLLTTLAAPGIVLFANSVGTVLPRPGTAVPLLIVGLLIPYVVLMGGAATASADNPFIEEGHGTPRHSITATEQALGDHANRYDSESIRIVSDARYRYSSGTIAMDYYDPQSLASEDPVLVANRAYLSKDPAMYVLRFEGRATGVYGGVPIEELESTYKMTVYDAGSDELLWVEKR